MYFTRACDDTIRKEKQIKEASKKIKNILNKLDEEDKGEVIYRTFKIIFEINVRED